MLTLARWWYTTGWARLFGHIGQRASNVLAAFSVGLLARTLFDPFRQIAAGRSSGSLNDQTRAFADRTFSRFIGAFVRFMVIVIGLLAWLIVVLIGLVQAVLWPVVPLLPIVGLVLAMTGWVIG